MTGVSFWPKKHVNAESTFKILIFGHFNHFRPPYMVKSGHFSNFIKNTWYGAYLKPNCMLNSALSLEIHFMIILSIFDRYGLIWIGMAMAGHFSKTIKILILHDFPQFDHLMESKMVKSRINHGILSLIGSVFIWFLVSLHL